MKKYLIDTSAIIEKVPSKLIKEKKLSGEIIITNASMSELENQANRRQEIGFIGLEEIQNLQKIKSKTIQLRFVGERPTPNQIKFAKAGEIDAIIREHAVKEEATLITADRVQAESAKAFNLNVIFIEPKPFKEKLKIEKFFDTKTMSVHLKENCHPMAKKGSPGNWNLTTISKKKLNYKILREYAKEIVEKANIDSKSFVEISRSGSTIIQYRNYRIVIVRPPVSDGIEITAVRPIKKLDLNQYKIPEEILERIKTKARGMIISGETGSGKSTFAQALGEFYSKDKKIVKTVESPRDLQLSPEITQYSKSFTSSEEMHDILFLSRPDNIIFDEIRDTPDFKLYTDLRLAGSNCIGVLHSASAIDAIQRFIPRMETGMIPSVLDTIIFIDSGNIGNVLTLKMTVKVPSGMIEADLARPVIEVTDFETKKLEYEIYSYGEETVIVPVEQQTKSKPSNALAEKHLENEMLNYVSEIKAEIISPTKAIVYIPENEISRIIGTGGKRIESIEKKIGIKLDVRPLVREKETIHYNTSESKKHLIFQVDKNYNKTSIGLYLEDKFICYAIAGIKGEIRFNKKSELGRILLDGLNTNKKLELKV
ncbi:MAG: PINc/VapC family ATPase [Nanoarchaeota archaeon]|nr:PINc/VapC family ATPase [Nanoarchaeota archaeon]MBU1444703.1 PINc/VapC family ATPase [Nanoarchaeota archaeon]MBU2420555.1 PINc/VapC family ATPase [Nanoarchaeota archaeon]MBU2475778.1 PINc/VapC family ATPase [Nanoarchaeota archaeon]